MSAEPVLADEGFHACDNCGTRWHYTQLNEMKDFYQRVAAGEPVPSGDCPDCGAFCHPVECAITTLAKDPDENWRNNEIQFPRLIAELEASGAFTKRVLTELRNNTDLQQDQLDEIIERAVNVWDNIKENTKPK